MFYISFCKEQIVPRESKIIEIINETKDSIDEDKDLEFNLFQ